MSQYIITMRWYVESDEQMEEELKNISLEDRNEKILNLLRHRENGTECCSTCPTRSNESAVVLDWKNFYQKKTIYMSVKKTKSNTE